MTFNNLRLNLFLILFLMLGVSASQGAISMEGSHSWLVKNGKCTFSTTGRVVNKNSGGESGTLRLCLWVTAGHYSTASSGYRISTCNLGTLRGGYQFEGYKVSAKAQMPRLTGFYDFTIALEEYTNNGWVNVYYISTGTQYMKLGSIQKPRVWKAPAGPIKPPLPELRIGQNITLTLKGSQSHGYAVYVPVGSQLKLRAKIGENGTTVVYGGSKPQGAPALYSYHTSTDTHADKTVPVGRLYLDYGYYYNVSSYSDHTLFFKAKNKGFYKALDTQYEQSGNSYGIFTVK